jgi:hypothetical protein
MITSVLSSAERSGGRRHFRLRDGIVGQILAHHRDIFVRHHFARGDRHHLAQ